MSAVLLLLIWWVFGVVSAFWWWTSEFDLELTDAVFLGLVALPAGPLMFLVGFLVHYNKRRSGRTILLRKR